MLKAGDGERENVVKGGIWRHEDDMRISGGEPCGKGAVLWIKRRGKWNRLSRGCKISEVQGGALVSLQKCVSWNNLR